MKSLLIFGQIKIKIIEEFSDDSNRGRMLELLEPLEIQLIEDDEAMSRIMETQFRIETKLEALFKTLRIQS